MDSRQRPDDRPPWEESEEAGESPPQLPAPWEAEGFTDGDDEPERRTRHDAFTRVKRREFLRALAECGCILESCRKAGVSKSTVYRLQDEDQLFFNQCGLAMRMAATDIESVAWDRAVNGVEQQFACGNRVYTRVRHSDSLLRLLLQASDPEKYGPRPGFSRTRLLKAERERIEREVREKIRGEWDFDKAIAALDTKLEHFWEREDAQRLEEGWQKSEYGEWVPPGWVRAEDPEADSAAAAELEGPEGDDGDTPRDSLSNSSHSSQSSQSSHSTDGGEERS